MIHKVMCIVFLFVVTSLFCQVSLKDFQDDLHRIKKGEILFDWKIRYDEHGTSFYSDEPDIEVDLIFAEKYRSGQLIGKRVPPAELRNLVKAEILDSDKQVQNISCSYRSVAKDEQPNFSHWKNSYILSIPIKGHLKPGKYELRLRVEFPNKKLRVLGEPTPDSGKTSVQFEVKPVKTEADKENLAVLSLQRKRKKQDDTFLKDARDILLNKEYSRKSRMLAYILTSGYFIDKNDRVNSMAWLLVGNRISTGKPNYHSYSTVVKRFGGWKTLIEQRDEILKKAKTIESEYFKDYKKTNPPECLDVKYIYEKHIQPHEKFISKHMKDGNHTHNHEKEK